MLYRFKEAWRAMQMPPSPDLPPQSRLRHMAYIAAGHVAYALLQVVAWLVLPVISRSITLRHVNRIPHYGPVILTPNHMSHWDTIIVGAYGHRPSISMAKHELFSVPFAGGLIRLLGGFPIKRGEPNRQTLQWTVEMLRQGGQFFVFPEGTRSKNYTVQPGKEGVALIARLSDAPIVPLAITGTEYYMRRAGKWGVLRRPPITLTAGEPYYLRDLVPGGDVKKADLEDLTDIIMFKIAEQLPPEYRGEFTGTYLEERRAERARQRQIAAEERAKRKAASNAARRE